MTLITLQNNAPILDAKTAENLAYLETEIKSLQDMAQNIKNAILREMIERNIYKIETEGLTLTYIAAHDRETFDSKRFRAEHPDEYDEYVKISKVKPGLRVTL